MRILKVFRYSEGIMKSVQYLTREFDIFIDGTELFDEIRCLKMFCGEQKYVNCTNEEA